MVPKIPLIKANLIFRLCNKTIDVTKSKISIKPPWNVIKLSDWGVAIAITIYNKTGIMYAIFKVKNNFLLIILTYQIIFVIKLHNKLNTYIEINIQINTTKFYIKESVLTNI